MKPLLQTILIAALGALIVFGLLWVLISFATPAAKMMAVTVISGVMS